LLRTTRTPRGASTHAACALCGRNPPTTAPGLKYEDELLEDIKQRTAPDDKPEKPLRKVGGNGWGRSQAGGICH